MAAAAFTASVAVGDKATASAENNLIANEVIVDSGTKTITPSAANTPTVGSVTFSKTFPSAPVVVVTPQSTLPGTNVTGVGATNITTTGCDIYLTRTNTTATPISWVAVLSK